jgi:hypothetical protein
MSTTLTLDPCASPPRSSRSGFRLRGTTHRVALTAHVLTSVGWFGIAVLVAFCGIAASVTGERVMSDALYRVIETAPWLSIPFGVAAFATGVLLGLGTKYGIVRYWWVVAKIVIALAVIVTDAVLVRTVAHDALVSGHAAGPLYGSTVAHVVVLAVATVLSVFKPGGVTPRGRRARRTPAASS